MRIAQIVEHLDVGGLERIAVDLAIAQKAAGHEPAIYCVAYPGRLAAEAQGAGIPVTAFHKPLGFSLRAVWRIARQLRADGIEIVHTHNAVIHHYGAAAGLLARVPVVNTQHGLARLAMDRRQLRIFRSTIPFTRAVVFVAEDARRVFWDANGFPAGKAGVILNGIHLERFTAHPATPGAHLPRIRFGTVGRLAPVKDHATLLRAFAVASRDLPDAELHILGYGPLEDATRTLARELGIEKRFQIHAPDSGVPRFLSSLDAFVLSSESEGLPVCILEAMAAGLPVIGTRVGGVPEAAPEGEVAWYSPAGNSEMLAANLLSAALSGELATRGRRAANIAVERFGIAKTWERYEALFRSLTAASHTRKR